MEKFRNSRDRFDRRRIPGKLMLANGEAQITESSSTGDRLHFSALPGEIKNKIYRLLLIAKEVKRAVKNRAPSYDFNTAILQVSRQFHNEAGGILYLENTFIRVTTTSGRLQQAVSDNFLPIISMGSCTSDNFPTQALQVQVHLSPKPILLECGEQCTFLITLEELPAFCTVLWLCCCVGQELGRKGVLDLRIPHSHPPRFIKEQRQLLLPFTIVHSFNEVNIFGTVNPSLALDVEDAMTSRRFFLVSDIVDEVLRLQGEVSAALEASDYPTGLNKGLKAFTKLAEVLDSRNRRYYIPILNTIINSGVHCGKSYDQATYELSFQMTLLMVKILLELEEWARARSLAENTLEDVQSGPFPQCKRDIGRLYVLQGLASKGMNDMKTAEKELTYGLVFLPNDPMIIQELVSMRLYLRDIDGDPFATLTEAVVAAGTGECSLCDRQKFLGKKLAV